MTRPPRTARRPVRRPARAVASLALMALVPATACSAGEDADDARAAVSTRETLADAPLPLTISGVGEDTEVEIRLSSDLAGARAESRATFVPAADGTVDLADDAPATGDYTEASAYGLLWSLRADLPTIPEASSQLVEVSVEVDGERVDEVSVTRVLRSEDVTITELTEDSEGLTGYQFAPQAPKGPAVLFIGGSEGGVAGLVEAQLLASRGYHTLALSYFGAAGQTDTLERVELETFTDAARWLAGQPGVDPHRVVAYGVSRGSEAALLAASHRPDLFGGVVGLAPSGVAGSAVDSWKRPAWTWRGQPVPHATSLRQLLRRPGAAAIEVSDIDSPLLLVCGRADEVWPACRFAADIEARRAPGQATTIAAFDDVGHEIGFLPPGFPTPQPLAGEDPDAAGLARVTAWRQLLDYLAAL